MLHCLLRSAQVTVQFYYFMWNNWLKIDYEQIYVKPDNKRIQYCNEKLVKIINPVYVTK